MTAYRADGGDIGIGRLKEIADNTYSDEEKRWLAQRVLTLLDELEHYKSREDRVTKLVLDNSTSWDELYKKLEAAEKRITELEAREVKLPKPISVLHRRDFNDAHRAIYAYPEAEVNAALAAAGIGVKGE
ncbi:hypothetical protein DMO52_08310 [Salmonella enterica subsp. enterica serovar Amager]|nr:hypothetical protein [Salmonella enterica subsp. enterica serovar Amager]EBV5217486.1 ead/Ea22-like family protein [Salmonella enterica subsp. enterica serovar Amager]